MAKYEIDLLIKGSLDEAAVAKSIKPLISLVEKQSEYNCDEWGRKDLAYTIKGEKSAYYYIITFSSNDPKIIKEFKRISNISQFVLRCLIINIEKTYGFRSTINEKRIKSNNIKQGKYVAKQNEYLANRQAHRDALANDETYNIDDKEEYSIDAPISAEETPENTDSGSKE